jgi:hypothetical protein
MVNEPDCPYALTFHEVTITDVSADIVTFVTRSAGPGEVQRLLRRFTCRRSVDGVPQILLELPAEAPPHITRLERMETGRLCLHRDVWTTTSDGFQIYGAGTHAIVFKYPQCLPELIPISTLRVDATSIRVTGFVAAIEGQQVIELLGPDCAASQTIDWTGAGNVSIALSPQGVRRFNLPASTTSVEVWPTLMVVAGKPAADPEVDGDADILHAEHAAGLQKLHIQGPTPRVSLELTPRGFAEFHVVPGELQDIADGPVPSPEVIQKARAIVKELDQIKLTNPDKFEKLSAPSRKRLEAARAKLRDYP